MKVKILRNTQSCWRSFSFLWLVRFAWSVPMLTTHFPLSLAPYSSIPSGKLNWISGHDRQNCPFTMPAKATNLNRHGAVIQLPRDLSIGSAVMCETQVETRFSPEWSRDCQPPKKFPFMRSNLFNRMMRRITFGESLSRQLPAEPLLRSKLVWHGLGVALYLSKSEPAGSHYADLSTTHVIS